MKTALVAYAGSLGTLLVLDAIWLSIVARTFYRDQLGDLMLPSPNLGIAAIFYLFFAVAVVVLAVYPAITSGSAWTAVIYSLIKGYSSLRNLRRDEPRHTEELAAADEHRRPRLGRLHHRDDGCRRFCRPRPQLNSHLNLEL